MRGAQILLQVVNGALCRRTLHEFGFRAFRIVGTDAFLLARPVARTPMMAYYDAAQPFNHTDIVTMSCDQTSCCMYASSDSDQQYHVLLILYKMYNA